MTRVALQDTLAFMTPELASVGRNLVGSLSDTRRDQRRAGVSHRLRGSSDVLHALMGEIEIKCVLGHSSGAPGDRQRVAGPGRIVTLGCPIPEEIAGATEPVPATRLASPNAWGNTPDQWTASDHSTNTSPLPLSMDAEALVAPSFDGLA